MDRYFGQHNEPVCAAVGEATAFPDGRGSATHAVDEATTRYILETRKAFEDLRQVAAQLAGLLVLAAAGSKSAGPHHPMLESAKQLFEEGHDAIRRARVPKRAQRHHDSLLRAAGALQAALLAAYRSPEIDPVLLPLREAYAQLQHASNELPGFPMVAFEQGCCGRAS
jgi:hypothetical protein